MDKIVLYEAPKWFDFEELAQRHDSIDNIDGLMQKRCNSIANALELRLLCIKPLICLSWLFH